MLLLIDHYDSFIDMIADYCQQLGADYTIVKTDQINHDLLCQIQPTHLIIGPGPGHSSSPELFATKILLDQAIVKQIPLLGICLGQQIIAEYFGGKVVPAKQIAHGLSSSIYHNQDQLFAGIPDAFAATRYHSLIVDSESLKNTPLQISAWTSKNEVMAICHPQLAIYGVQFHPESVMTEHGLQILANFLATNRYSTTNNSLAKWRQSHLVGVETFI